LSLDILHRFMNMKQAVYLRFIQIVLFTVKVNNSSMQSVSDILLSKYVVESRAVEDIIIINTILPTDSYFDEEIKN